MGNVLPIGVEVLYFNRRNNFKPLFQILLPLKTCLNPENERRVNRWDISCLKSEHLSCKHKNICCVERGVFVVLKKKNLLSREGNICPPEKMEKNFSPAIHQPQRLDQARRRQSE